jgi:hypothetical protein
VPYDGVGGRELLLEPPDGEEERREAEPHDCCQLPAVDEHQHGRDEHLADADHEDQAAEHQELADLVDVGGDAGDECSSALGVLGEEGQVVDVAEGAGAQRRQAPLGRGEEPARHAVGGPRRERDGDRGEHPHPRDVVEARSTGSVEPAVERLLHRDRHDDLAARGDDREQEGDAQALAELG